MGLLSKLHLKKDKKDPAEADDGKGHRHHTKPKKTQHKYESEDVVEGERDTSKVGSAQLVIGDAPTAPGGGGGGFQSNTNYAINTGGAPGPVNPKGGGEGGSVLLLHGVHNEAFHEVIKVARLLLDQRHSIRPGLEAIAPQAIVQTARHEL